MFKKPFNVVLNRRNKLKTLTLKIMVKYLHQGRSSFYLGLDNLRVGEWFILIEQIYLDLS